MDTATLEEGEFYVLTIGTASINVKYMGRVEHPISNAGFAFQIYDDGGTPITITHFTANLVANYITKPS